MRPKHNEQDSKANLEQRHRVANLDKEKWLTHSDLTNSEALMRLNTTRHRSNSVTSTEEDVRSSLDLLDNVLCEFDDTPTDLDSDFDCSFVHNTSHNPRLEKQRLEADLRSRKNITTSTSTLNERIESIFSEVADEIIYQDAKDAAARRISMPTTPSSRTMSVSTTSKASSSSSSASMTPLVSMATMTTSSTTTPRNSVMAQVHSLEARARTEDRSVRAEKTHASNSNCSVTRSRSAHPSDGSSARSRAPNCSQPLSKGSWLSASVNDVSKERRTSRASRFSEPVTHFHGRRGRQRDEGERHHRPKRAHPELEHPPPSVSEARHAIERMMMPRTSAPMRQKSLMDLRRVNADHSKMATSSTPWSAMSNTDLSKSSQAMWREGKQSSSRLSRHQPMLRSVTEHDLRNRHQDGRQPHKEPRHQPDHEAPREGRSRRSAHDSAIRGDRPRSVSHMNLHEARSEDQLLMRQLTLEARRELLLRNGFSPSHPFISGKLNIHPELQRRLPFNAPARTLPLGPDDYDRFRPELWMDEEEEEEEELDDFYLDEKSLDNERRRTKKRVESSRGNVETAKVSFRDASLVRAELELRRQRSNNQAGVDQSFHSLPFEQLINEQSAHFRASALALERRREEILRSAGINDVDNLKKPSKIGQWFNRKSNKTRSASDIKDHNHWVLKRPFSYHEPSIHKPEQRSSRTKQKSSFDKQEKNLELKADMDEEVELEASCSGTNRSSFGGIILSNKLKKNNNVYFPIGHNTKTTDVDNVVDDVVSGSASEGSKSVIEDELFMSGPTSTSSSTSSSKENVLMEKQSSSSSMLSPPPSISPRSSGVQSSLSPHNSIEGSPRLNKTKTIRNYAPDESRGQLHRELQNRRQGLKMANKSEQQTSNVHQMIADFHRNLPPLGPKPTHKGFRAMDTLTSQASNWSAASSSNSFDYRPATKAGQPVMEEEVRRPRNKMRNKMNSNTNLACVHEVDVHVHPEGERVPPDGAASSTIGSQVVKVNNALATNSADNMDEVEMDDDHMDVQVSRLPSDEFDNLGLLLSEGRIAGLNEKPPSFTPPTPPLRSSATTTTTRPSPTRQPTRPSPTATTTTPTSRPINASSTPTTTASDKTRVGGRWRKSREAPQPPSALAPRRERRCESTEDLSASNRTSGRTEIKRSSSSHETKNSRYEANRRRGDMRTAQLIADSTERKFTFNPFKAMYRKKKAYSFDFI